MNTRFCGEVTHFMRNIVIDRLDNGLIRISLSLISISYYKCSSFLFFGLIRRCERKIRLLEIDEIPNMPPSSGFDSFSVVRSSNYVCEVKIDKYETHVMT